MPGTRVFEDVDLPGAGEPFRVEVLLDLVDCDTKRVVREAYFEGRTIAGTARAKIDGGAAMWWTQPSARSQWEEALAPNSQIVYNGSPGGTFWRRKLSTRSPYAYPVGNIKPTTAYIDVPVSDERLLFPNLVVPDTDTSGVDFVWGDDGKLLAGDSWRHTLRFTDTQTDPDVEPEPLDKTDYTYELELRRSRRDAIVRAATTFDYADAATGTIGMLIDSATSATLFGRYFAALQEYDPDMERTTLANWAFIFSPNS